MNAVSSGIKNIFISSSRLLNQPLVKEGVKNVAGQVTFVFGLVELYDIYQITQGREISTEAGAYSNSPKWMQVANKVSIVCAKISLVLSAGVSRPGVLIISSLVGTVVSTSQLTRVFGQNTIFAVNPWHPRHVASIAAVVLALPSLMQSAYKGVHSIQKKISYPVKASANASDAKTWFTDAKINLMNLFNTITSRPTLHVGNQLGRILLHP